MGDQGAALTSIDPLIDAIALLEAADASATAIVLHPRSWSELLGLRETSESLRPLLVDAAGSPTRGVQKSILGVPAFTSSQLSVTETQGAAENATSIYVYQADQVVAVRRREARVELDRSRLFHHDSSELRAICRFDVVVPNPAAVVRIKGIVPPAP